MGEKDEAARRFADAAARPGSLLVTSPGELADEARRLGIAVLAHESVEKGKVYVLPGDWGKPGPFPVRSELTVLPADESAPVIGWKMHETLGVMAVNPKVSGMFIDENVVLLEAPLPIFPDGVIQAVWCNTRTSIMAKGSALSMGSVTSELRFIGFVDETGFIPEAGPGGLDLPGRVVHKLAGRRPSQAESSDPFWECFLIEAVSRHVAMTVMDS